MSDLHAIANAADLRAALQSGQIERADIAATDLPPVEVGAVRMNHVRMMGTKLVGLHINGLHASRVHGRGVLLRATRFERAELLQWDISASQAQEIQWPAARLQDCRFTETPLTNANLQRSILVGCEFALSDLNHANLSEALILHSNFTDTRQGGAVLDNANLSSAVLCHVNLRGANLFRASFQHAVLIGVDLRDANLTGVSFRDAVLIDCKTERAEMSGSTVQELAQAGGSLAEVFERLKHLPAEQTAMMAAALLVRGATATPSSAGNSAASATNASGQLDPMATLMRLSFAAMIRELQGRGGPAELGQLRVDGDHVYARSTGGDEIRLTSARADAPRQAAQMRVPDPGQPAARPAPAPVAAPAATPAPGGRFGGGLEID
jgi:uncharacterized protein YjbI with pentapeptide repeats